MVLEAGKSQIKVVAGLVCSKTRLPGFLLCPHTAEKKVSVSHSIIPTLGDPTDCSPPGSSVHGILQARVLEWVAIPFSR